MDFKGYYAILVGFCHPLTVTDDHSRFNILLRACPAERGLLVQEAVVEAFRACGMPVALQFDNGPPWGRYHKRTTDADLPGGVVDAPGSRSALYRALPPAKQRQRQSASTAL